MSRCSPALPLLLVGLLFAACGESRESGSTIDPEGPRAAFESYRKAMREGDLDALQATLAASAREAVARVEPEVAIKLIQSLLPSGETVTGSETNGDSATIHLTADHDGTTAGGKVLLVKEDGKWKVEKESWDLGGGDVDVPEPDEGEPLDLKPDGDWRLDCHELSITDEPAAGRVAGAPFTVRFAKLQNNILTLTDGDNFKWGGQFLIFLFLRGDDQTVAGRTITIGPKTDWSAKVNAHVHFGYQTEDGATETTVKTEGFALRLEFGEEQDGKLPGKIHLSYPDEKKSYVVGSFTATLE